MILKGYLQKGTCPILGTHQVWSTVNMSWLCYSTDKVGHMHYGLLDLFLICSATQCNFLFSDQHWACAWSWMCVTLACILVLEQPFQKFPLSCVSWSLSVSHLFGAFDNVDHIFVCSHIFMFSCCMCLCMLALNSVVCVHQSMPCMHVN